MKTADIIIGLGFGDEGKGITTDFLAARNPDAVVIRFSGGQQAAHTVMIGNRKHVHSSFCSGALRGLPSYFTEHCTIHPVFMYNEWKELKSKNGNTSLHIHPLAKVTTPFDVLHNRKDIRNTEHGTCGKGIGATMKRHESPYRLFAADLIAPRAMLIEKLKGIAFYYGFSDGEEIQAALDDFVHAIDQMEWKIEGYSYLNTFDHLIFEGSQGILLDMDHGIFPNVTYAHTTSKNAHEVCRQIGIDHIEMYYVTRSYATRHGNGWMSNEKELSLQNNDEETCTFNEYQGAFRTGDLDDDLLNYALKVDEGYGSAHRKHLVVTCLDQLDTTFKTENLKVSFDTVFGSYAPDLEAFRKLAGRNSLSDTTICIDC